MKFIWYYVLFVSFLVICYLGWNTYKFSNIEEAQFWETGQLPKATTAVPEIIVEGGNSPSSPNLNPSPLQTEVEDIQEILFKLLCQIDGGDVEACYLLASKYLEGETGFPRNKAKAINYYKKAAALGHLQSILQLEKIYDDMSQNPAYEKLALDCKFMAAGCGHYTTLHELAYVLELGGTSIVIFEPELKPEGPAPEKIPEGENLNQVRLLVSEIAEANNGLIEPDPVKAEKLYTLMAETGDLRSILHLANTYLNEYGIPIDYFKAAYWHTKAIERGISDSYATLGEMHENGSGFPKDLNKAAYYYRIGFGDFNNLTCGMSLARLYTNIESPLYNVQAAFELLSLLVNKGNIRYQFPQFELARMHLLGLGTEPDTERALQLLEYSWRYYLKEKPRSELDCAYLLGKWFGEGIQGRKYPNRSEELFQFAADLGHGPSIHELENIQTSTF